MSKSNKVKYINHVDLSGLNYLFKPGDKLQLSKCNLIFGRNASGKSSISRYIKKYGNKILSNKSNNTNIHVFNRSYILNHLTTNTINNKSTKQLTSISLGKTNANINNEINKLHSDDNFLRKQLTIINHKLNNKKSIYTKKNLIKEHWLIKSARHLKNTYRELISSSYNKRDFAKDLSKSFQNISSNEINNLKKKLSKNNNKKIVLPHNIFPNIPMTNLYVEASSTLKSTVGPNFLRSIRGIDNNKKVAFAEQGMKLHKHCDICAFCGNKISQDRRNELHEFFNKRYYIILNKIKDLRLQIRTFQKDLANIYQLNVEAFNSKYQSSAKIINKEIQRLYKYYRHLLNLLNNYLDNKIQNINSIMSAPNYQFNLSFPLLNEQLHELVNKNNMYQKHINEFINKPHIINVIRLYYVNKTKNDFISRHPNLQYILKSLHQDIQTLNENLSIKEKQIRNNASNERALLSKSKKENIAEKSINKNLKYLRDNSFRLRYSKNNNGEYYISSNNNGHERGFNTLSLGERNLISFLYFYNAISPINPYINESKNQLIIFDDPMDGNDVEFQYLMAYLLQKLIKKITNKNDKGHLSHTEYRNYQLIIFTHDVNFYLNIKHGISKNKLNNIHLIKLENGTGIQNITKNIPDFYNNYESLWAETFFLYNKHQYNIMLNPIRRIIETFINFNYIPKDKFFKGHENIKKLLDINSHGINDINAMPYVHNGKYIMETLRTLFYNTEGKRHFNKYYDKFKDYGKSYAN